MLEKIRVGVVGTSWWADEMHLPSLKSHPRAEVVAICGRDATRANAMAAKYAIAHVFTDYRAMIERANLHALVVSVPDDLHYAVTMAALEAGLHVVCEKPLALNATQARAMYELAEAKRVKHLTYFTWRWLPPLRYVKQLVDDGYVGRVFHCQFNQVGGYARSNKYGWHFDGARAMGVVSDLGSHMLDLARWYVGEVASVSAQLSVCVARDGTDTPANDAASLMLRFADGAHGTLQVSAVAQTGQRGHEMRFGIYGDAGSLTFTNRSGHAEIRGVREGDDDWRVLPVPDALWGDVNRARPYEVFEKQSAGCRAFIDAISADTSITPSFHDGWRAQAVIDAALEADRMGRWVDVMRDA